MQVGHRQLNLLSVLARPGTALIVGDKLARSLVSRGLAQQARHDAIISITSSGLRALADAADAGKIKLRVEPEDMKPKPAK